MSVTDKDGRTGSLVSKIGLGGNRGMPKLYIFKGSIPDLPFPLYPSRTELDASHIRECFPFDLSGLPLGFIVNNIRFSIGLDFQIYNEYCYSFSSLVSRMPPGIVIDHLGSAATSSEVYSKWDHPHKNCF